MGFHDDKLLIEDTFRLSGIAMSEDLDSLVQPRQKPQYEEMTVSGLSLNEEFDEVMSIIGNKAKGVKKPQKLAESMDEAGGPAGMGPQDQPWKIYVNGEYVKKTRHVASFINSYEMDGLDVDENWDADKNSVYLTVNLPADEDEVEEACGKKREMKEDEGKSYKMSKSYEIVSPESREQGDVEEHGFVYQDQEFDSIKSMADAIKEEGHVEASNYPINLKQMSGVWFSTVDAESDLSTGNDKFYSFHPELNSEEEYKELLSYLGDYLYGNPVKGMNAEMAMEGKDIYDCLNGLVECIEHGTDFCLNLSEDANKTRKLVSTWIESRILPKMEAILGEMEPEEDEIADGFMPGDSEPEGEPEVDSEPEGEPEGEEHDYDEKEELKYVEELDSVVQALKISLEKIDDEETRIEIEKLADNTESIVKDLRELHGVETDSEDEGEEDNGDEDSEEESEKEEATESKDEFIVNQK